MLKRSLHHYTPPDRKYITCKNFGNYNGLNDCCYDCYNENLYQYRMCRDEQFLRMIMENPLNNEEVKASKLRENTARYIDKYK